MLTRFTEKAITILKQKLIKILACCIDLCRVSFALAHIYTLIKMHRALLIPVPAVDMF